MHELLSDAPSRRESVAMADARTLLLKNEIDVDEIIEFPNGVAAQNFFARGRDGRAFVVRYDRRRSLPVVQEDRLFSELARRNGFEVPLGPWMECMVDGATIVARPYIEGQTLLDIPTEIWPRGCRFGSLLATLHTVRSPVTRRPFFYRSTLDLAPEACSRLSATLCLMADTSEDAALLQDATDRLRAAPRDRLRLQASPERLIHGDFAPGNFLVAGAKLYLIDWEKACVGPIDSDLAQAMYYFGAAVAGGARSFLTSFIDAYRRKRPIAIEPSRAWLTLHPAVILLHDAVTTLAERHSLQTDLAAKREVYFRTRSLPRYKSFLGMEAMMLDLISARR